ncbi:MAG: DUF3341 domain-containing protein [Elusimicrobia bacterium]|nr:DUF3341 domain-containing protein [Elusimicrobiota bacterium]
MAGTKLVVGRWDGPDTVLAAARAARAAGYSCRDAYTPFPVHGMDAALGLEPSWLGKACLGFALAGLTGALGFQFWVSVFDWPMNVGGKSFSASPALIPVAFELTVLCAGLGTVATFLVFRGLSPARRPELEGLGATDDRFLLAFAPEAGAEAGLKAFLLEHGARDVRELEAPR